MNVLIDGHNLIGQMPNISLDEQDDEAQLVMALRRYATTSRKRSVIVVFDHGVYGHPLKLDGYGITCYFARSPQDADTQLINRIGAIQRPREWRVITSDRAVARAAADRGVKVISSVEFARELSAPPPSRRPAAKEKAEDVRLSAAEVNEWLRMFGEEPDPTPALPRPAPKPTSPAPVDSSNPAQTAKRRGNKKRARKK